jgi:hypothetical protein
MTNKCNRQTQRKKRKWQINVTDRRKERNKMKKGWKENRQKKKSSKDYRDLKCCKYLKDKNNIVNIIHSFQNFFPLLNTLRVVLH